MATPKFKRNLKLEEFYRRKEEEANLKTIRKYNLKKLLSAKALITFAFFIFLAGAIILTTYNTLKGNTILRSRAGTGGTQVKIYLFPKEIQTLISKSFTVSPKLVSVADKKVGLILLSIHFDKSHISLKEITTSGLSQNLILLKSTPLDTANSSGVVKILVGAEDDEAAPSGGINLFNLTFNALIAKTSEIWIEKAESQIVFTSNEIAELEIDTKSRIDSNPLPTPTVLATTTPLPTPTATPIPTPSPASTSTPIPTPFLTSIPTPATSSAANTTD